MLTKSDLKEVENLLSPIKKMQDKHAKTFDRIGSKLGEVKEKLDSNTVSVMKIEEKIDKALELRVDVGDLRKQVKDHEERITQLEKF